MPDPTPDTWTITVEVPTVIPVCPFCGEAVLFDGDLPESTLRAAKGRVRNLPDAAPDPVEQLRSAAEALLIGILIAQDNAMAQHVKDHSPAELIQAVVTRDATIAELVAQSAATAPDTAWRTANQPIDAEIQCGAQHPVTGRDCLLPAGHDSHHRNTLTTWYDDDDTRPTVDGRPLAAEGDSRCRETPTGRRRCLLLAGHSGPHLVKEPPVHVGQDG